MSKMAFRAWLASTSHREARQASDSPPQTMRVSGTAALALMTTHMATALDRGTFACWPSSDRAARYWLAASPRQSLLRPSSLHQRRRQHTGMAPVPAASVRLAGSTQQATQLIGTFQLATLARRTGMWTILGRSLTVTLTQLAESPGRPRPQ